MSSDEKMSSNRPYLIRALYDWLVDNGMTPYLLVNARDPGVAVPEQFVDEEGRIVLNVSPSAVRGLQLGNEMILFSARFGGAPMEVVVPPGAVLGIYARENGRGMLFPDEESGSSDEPPDPDSPKPRRSDKPSLKVVK